METQEKIDRILLREDSQAIVEFELALQNNVTIVKRTLNSILKFFAFEEVNQIPKDVDIYILERLLKSNKQAKAMHEITPLEIDKIKLPDDLRELRTALHTWNKLDHTLTKYLLKGDEGFDINDGLISKAVYEFAETKRVYASTPDQLERYRIAKTILDAVNDSIKLGGYNFKRYENGLNMFYNSFIVWRSYPLHRFELNSDYILNGFSIRH